MNEAFFRGVNNGLVKRAAGEGIPGFQDPNERFRKYVDPIGAVAKENKILTNNTPVSGFPYMPAPENPNTWDLAKGRVIGTTAGGTLGALAGNSLRNKILLGLLGGGTGYLAGDYYDRGDNSLVGQGLSKLFSLFQSNKDKSDKAKLLAANRNK